MPSPEVIDCTLSDDESQPDLVQSNQTPSFSTHNQAIFERLLPTPSPQVGDILSEEEDSESEQELIA